MCGIAGYFGTSTLKLENFKQTSEILKHRGPDGEGFFSHKFQDNNQDELLSLLSKFLTIYPTLSREQFFLQTKFLFSSKEILLVSYLHHYEAHVLYVGC